MGELIKSLSELTQSLQLLVNQLTTLSQQTKPEQLSLFQILSLASPILTGIFLWFFNRKLNNTNNKQNAKLEEYKNEFQTRVLSYETEKSLKLKNFDRTIKRIVEMNNKLRECYWMLIDSKDTNNLTSFSRKAMKIKRFIHDSVLFIDGKVLSAAVMIWVKIIEAFGYRKDDYNNGYSKLLVEIESYMTKFYQLTREKYFFDGPDGLLNTEKLLKDTEKKLEDISVKPE